MKLSVAGGCLLAVVSSFAGIRPEIAAERKDGQTVRIAATEFSKFYRQPDADETIHLDGKDEVFN